MWFFKQSNQTPTYSLPTKRCSGLILIAGTQYKNIGFHADVYVETEKLIPWSIEYAQFTSGGTELQKIARKKLPEWLSGADFLNNSVTVLDDTQQEILRPHSMDLVEKGIAFAYCPQCLKNYTSLKNTAENLSSRGNERNFNLSYHCHDGHLIYKKNHMIRYF